ncbi:MULTISPECIES: hypothetical protein [unclassified Beijerinckia]|uniref:hypothetical protein n=1 Tax=unclassified Beijerinckia TaxID=2638183 RepID=UPI00089C8402|nr:MULTISPECIES: hypothetical protein [unclassified Beijerinckia]MDH7796245.1 hypothetical protein [Beijerinckia sp. GAS462]SEC36703.1 hypothetical protein SAMN05443249_2528 [Beijerinckia sp. 28-YEA-48]
MTVVTRLYDDFAHAQEAIALLERSGVPSADISIVANTTDRWRAYDNQDDQTGDPHLDNGSAGLLAGLGIVAIPGLGPVVAAGWLASMALGLVAGGAAGGITGALIESGVSEAEAHAYSEAVRRGGTLLTVRTHAAIHEKLETLLDAMTDHWSEQTNALGANIWPKAGRTHLRSVANTRPDPRTDAPYVGQTAWRLVG